jgi:hypothetical protein
VCYRDSQAQPRMSQQIGIHAREAPAVRCTRTHCLQMCLQQAVHAVV